MQSPAVYFLEIGSFIDEQLCNQLGVSIATLKFGEKKLRVKLVDVFHVAKQRRGYPSDACRLQPVPISTENRF